MNFKVDWDYITDIHFEKIDESARLETENAKIKAKLKVAIEALKECAIWYNQDDVNGEAGSTAFQALKELEEI